MLGITFIVLTLLSFFLLYKIPRHAGTLASIPATIEAFMFILISIYFFFEQISKPQALFIYQTPAFWVVIGILLYFAGAFFIFIYADGMTDAEIQKYWVINYAFNATKNILFAIAFLMKNNKEEYPSLTNTFQRF